MSPVVVGPVSRHWYRVALVVAAAVVPVVLVLATRLTAPSDGAVTYPSQPAWSSAGVGISEVSGHFGDLRVGDRVTAVDGIPLETWVANPPAHSFADGDTLRYDIVRDGVPMTVDVTLGPYEIREIALRHLPMAPLLVVLCAVASFVYLRRPTDPAARALFRLAVLAQLGLTAWPYSGQVIDLVTGRLWPTLLGEAATVLFWGAVLHFCLLFPRPPGVAARHPRLAAAAAYLYPVLAYVISTAGHLPQTDGALGRLRFIALSPPAANTVPLLAFVAILLLYVRAQDRSDRRRITLVLGALAFTAVTYVGLGRVPEYLWGRPLVPYDWHGMFFLPFPIAVGVAVLRYRLFDIAVALRRSLVYGVLTVTLAGAYLGVVLTLRSLFGVSVGPGPLVAGVVAAAMFIPLRSWVRGAVSRLIFGHRDDPYEVLRRLGQRLEKASSTESVLPSLVETLSQALRLPYAAVELAGGSGLHASVGQPAGHSITVPLVHAGERIGHLELDTGPEREPFGPADRRLLDGVSGQVAMIAHNLLLAQQLQKSLQRTVTAREEERRRLRRDIHDGLGPTLASSAMRIEHARRLLDQDPAAAAEVLVGVAGTQSAALAELRRVVHGLRPPVLDQLGLVSALRQRADRFTAESRGRPTVTFDAGDGLESLPAAVEVAVFHIASEAMTNAVKHAGARMCAVRLWRDGAAVRLEINDDGRGLPDVYSAGVGLTSMRERATELGGSASIAGGPGGGTEVRARLPL